MKHFKTFELVKIETIVALGSSYGRICNMETIIWRAIYETVFNKT